MKPVLRTNSVWMTANLLLAALPLVLAVALFGPTRTKTVRWWIGVAVFVIFLPNAPYVLTDVIHLLEQMPAAIGRLHLAALLAQYALLMGTGLAFYGGCLYLLRRRVTADGLAHWCWPAEISLHVLCSIGIFLGRVLRLNSRGLLVRPESVLRYVGGPRGSPIAL